MEKKKFYRDFVNTVKDIPEGIYLVDSIGCNTVDIYNTSLGGSIYVGGIGGVEVPPGSVFQAKGNENEINAGKIPVFLTNFFANIEYGFCIISKKFH